jgi:hypothetical protein
LSFIDHDPVFVVKRHGRDLALMMALSAPQLRYSLSSFFGRTTTHGYDAHEAAMAAFAKSWRKS